MVSERKEPTFSSTDIGRDERNQSAAIDPLSEKTEVKKGPTSNRSAAPRSRNPSSSPTVVTRSSPLSPIALILALTGLGLAGYAYWQLIQMQVVLVNSEQRIVELEQRLSLSSDESSASLTVLQANLKEANSEIAKLWDTRNVNRNGISGNVKALAELKKSLNSLTASVSGATKSIAGQESSLKALTAKVDEALVAANAAKKDSAEQAKALKALSQQLEQASAGIRQLGDLGVRVKTNEEAIEAIDAYRYQINRQILDLQKRVVN